MAADWTKLRNNLAGDPRVLAIAAATKLDRFAVVGRLHAVWAWAGEHTVDGRLVGATLAFVDELVGRKGFAQAMAAPGVEWLLVEDQGLIVPRWDEHNGRAAKERALDNRKKAAQRGKISPPQREFCPPSGGTESGTAPAFLSPDCPDGGGTFTGTRVRDRIQQQQQHNRRPTGAEPEPAAAPSLAELAERWPSRDLAAELRAASAYCQRNYGRPDVDLAWFARDWLPRATPRVTPAARPGGAAPAGRPVPVGWRAWIEDNCPGSPYAKGGAQEGREWHELDRATQDFIAAGMAAGKGAA